MENRKIAICLVTVELQEATDDDPIIILKLFPRVSWSNLRLHCNNIQLTVNICSPPATEQVGKATE